MNDPLVSAKALEELIDELKTAETIFERAALFSAIRVICTDFIDADYEQVNGYAKEKAGQIRWHSAAALGFDIDNGHSAQDHRAWAMGALWSLQDSLNQTLR